MTLNLKWRSRIRRIRYLLVNKALVLMYHRVANLTNDPWQLAVSPSNFEQQLQVLKKNYKLISVNQLITQLSKKSVSPNSVCITFDDGYSDNYFAAKPLLEKYECPATFFIASHFIASQQSFWWDELKQIILCSKKLPEKLSITINKQFFEFELEKDCILTDTQIKKQKSWVWSEKPPTQRCELYLALHKRIMCLPYSELQAVMGKIKYWGSYKKDAVENFPMTNQQLEDLAQHLLFDIGLHSATHPVLPSFPREIQLEEIAVNERFLKNNCKKVLRLLAYPYGKYDETTLSVVGEQKLLAAFTTEEQFITKRSESYRLGRFQVNNWNGEEFEKRLLSWLKGI